MTQCVNALAATTRVNDWLENSLSARILHIFDRACNLINEHREVLSVVASDIGPGPFNLVVSKLPWFPDHISIQSAVAATSNKLHIGNLIIQVQSAKLWNSHPDWKKLHAERDAILRQIKRLPNTTSLVTDRPISDDFAASVAVADLSASVSAAKKLAGLGQGLTPAGDDFIMGALHAAWIIHPREVAEVMAREIAATAAPLTTSLSGAWLNAAGTGEAGILWHTFLDSLVSGETINIAESMFKILSVGATSGADAMTGFINTINAYTEIEKKYVISFFIQ